MVKNWKRSTSRLYIVAAPLALSLAEFPPVWSALTGPQRSLHPPGTGARWMAVRTVWGSKSWHFPAHPRGPLFCHPAHPLRYLRARAWVSKLREIVKDREAWNNAVHGVTKWADKT